MRRRGIAQAAVRSCGLCTSVALGAAVYGQDGQPLAAVDNGAHLVAQAGALVREAPGVLANCVAAASITAIRSRPS